MSKCGVYAYCEDEDFEILLFGYALDEKEARVVDLKNEQSLPEEVMEALIDHNILKTAFNDNFERTWIASYFKVEMSSK